MKIEDYYSIPCIVNVQAKDKTSVDIPDYGLIVTGHDFCDALAKATRYMEAIVELDIQNNCEVVINENYDSLLARIGKVKGQVFVHALTVRMC